MPRHAIQIDGEMFVPYEDYLELQERYELLGRMMEVKGVDHLLVEPFDWEMLYRHVATANSELVKFWANLPDGSRQPDPSRVDMARTRLDEAMIMLKEHFDAIRRLKESQSGESS